MQPNLFLWINGFWIAFLLIWIVAAFKTKQSVRRHAGASRALQVILVIMGAILMWNPGLRIGPLGNRLWPDSVGLEYAGVALAFAGIAFAVWARFVIGQNWSSEITIKQEHELIRRGPYALVRHPIYSGVLLALAGTALYVDELRGLLGFALFVIGWWLKLRTEESFMLQQFGDQYRSYQRQVKALIPFVL